MKEHSINLFTNNFCNDVTDAKIKLVFFDWQPKYDLYIDKDTFCTDSEHDNETFSTNDIIELKGLCLIKPLGYTLSPFGDVTKIWCTKMRSKKNINKLIVKWYYTCANL